MNSTVEHWLAGGAPADKLVLGIPLYGQSFTLADPARSEVGAATVGRGRPGEFTRAGGFLAYHEICRAVDAGWSVVQDPLAAQGPYAWHEDQWVGFDDVASVRRKAELVLERGLGGAMVIKLCHLPLIYQPAYTGLGTRPGRFLRPVRLREVPAAADHPAGAERLPAAAPGLLTADRVAALVMNLISWWRAVVVFLLGKMKYKLSITLKKFYTLRENSNGGNFVLPFSSFISVISVIFATAMSDL